jgi:hypothetical protein
VLHIRSSDRVPPADEQARAHFGPCEPRAPGRYGTPGASHDAGRSLEPLSRLQGHSATLMRSSGRIRAKLSDWGGLLTRNVTEGGAGIVGGVTESDTCSVRVSP